jgi:hypothetical protein
LDWRRHARPRPPHRCGGAVASRLTVGEQSYEPGEWSG